MVDDDEMQRSRYEYREKVAMRNPALAAAGTVIALLGIVFFLQGVGVLKGSSMSNTTTWSVAGPIIALARLAIAAAGFRGRSR
jgi:uncharacterized transporter YbjL